MIQLSQIWPKYKRETIAVAVALVVIVTLIVLGIRNRPLKGYDNEEKLKLMHPTVQNRFRQFIREVEKKTGYKVEIVSAWRGWPDSLRIWQTNPQVQACCPPGQDYHMYGLAADIVLHGNGQRLGNASSRQAWESTGIRTIARKYDLQWGIDFNGYYDPVHFAYPKWPMDAIVNRAISEYGSLAKTPGNRMSMAGLPTRTWTIA